MFILIKFILKNIRTNKFRTFLITFSVGISCALFFASSAISLTLKDLYTESKKIMFGSADIVVQAGENSHSEYISLKSIDAFKNKIEYMVGEIQNSAEYVIDKGNVEKLKLRALAYDDWQVFNPLVMIDTESLLPFKGSKCIISKRFADKYQLKAGRILKIKLYHRVFNLLIAGISRDNGPFKREVNEKTVIMPLDKMIDLFDLKLKNRFNYSYIKIKPDTDKQKFISDLNNSNKRIFAAETINEKELTVYLQEIQVPLMIMTFVVIIISIFIIYTSFKVITMERLPVLGTFRSVGATKGNTSFILILESMGYGILGGIAGIFLGIFILYILSLVISYDAASNTFYYMGIRFDSSHIISTFVLSVLLALISSLSPILKISKIPVKDIVLNKTETKIRKKSWSFLLGIGFVILYIIIPYMSSKQLALGLNTICLLLIIFGFILLIPYISRWIIFIAKPLYRIIFGNEGLIACHNINENKTINNNITLLSIGIAGLLLINTASVSVAKDLFDIFKTANFKILLWVYESNKIKKSYIKAVEGVEDVFGSYEADEVLVTNKNKKITINNFEDEYLEFWDFTLDQAVIDKLKTGRYIIINKETEAKLEVGVGDKLILKTESGKKSYEIIHIYNFLIAESFIASRFLKQDFKIDQYGILYIKTGKNVDKAFTNLKKRFSRNSFIPFWLVKLSTIKEDEEKANKVFFIILRSYSFITLLIGIIGILNNYIISFIERKRHLAIMRSVGMSKYQTVKMIAIESFTGGVISGIVGLVNGLLLIRLVPFIMQAIDIKINMFYSVSYFVLSVFLGIMITIIASILPTIQSSKLNIIEAIRYE